MKKELWVKNLGWGSYRGAVSFMYGIHAVLKVSLFCYIEGYSKSKVVRKLTQQFGTDLYVV